MYNKVELCGVNTAELPILSEQEKRDLLTRARAGEIGRASCRERV